MSTTAGGRVSGSRGVSVFTADGRGSIVVRRRGVVRNNYSVVSRASGFRLLSHVDTVKIITLAVFRLGSGPHGVVVTNTSLDWREL